MTSSLAPPLTLGRSNQPLAWTASLRSPRLLGTFAGIGFLAGVLEFLLVFGLPFLRHVNGVTLALVVFLAALVGLTVGTKNLRLRFFSVGLGVGLIGLLLGMFLSRLVFFAFWRGSAI